MVESKASEDSFGGLTDDEVALMSRKFKQMLKKKGKFQHSYKKKDIRLKKKHKEEARVLRISERDCV